MKRASVLLVDDDELLLESLKAALSTHFITHTASDHLQAEKILSQHSIDSVLLDLGLGKKQGQELISDWRSRYPEMEIVILSGQKEIKLVIMHATWGN